MRAYGSAGRRLAHAARDVFQASKRSIPSRPIMTAFADRLQVGAGADVHPRHDLQSASLLAMEGGRPDRRRHLDARRGGTALARGGVALCTLGSAWFTFDDDKRGTLAAGEFAALAELTKDYLSVPTDEIARMSRLRALRGAQGAVVKVAPQEGNCDVPLPCPSNLV